MEETEHQRLDPSLGFELSHLLPPALNSYELPLPVTVQMLASPSCSQQPAAGNPSVNTLARLGPGGIEVTQK